MCRGFNSPFDLSLYVPVACLVSNSSSSASEKQPLPPQMLILLQPDRSAAPTALSENIRTYDTADTHFLGQPELIPSLKSSADVPPEGQDKSGTAKPAEHWQNPHSPICIIQIIK